MLKNFQKKLAKNAFSKKNAKIRKIKNLKLIHCHCKLCSTLFSNHKGGYLALEAEKA